MKLPRAKVSEEKSNQEPQASITAEIEETDKDHDLEDDEYDKE